MLLTVASSGTYFLGFSLSWSGVTVTNLVPLISFLFLLGLKQPCNYICHRSITIVTNVRTSKDNVVFVDSRIAAILTEADVTFTSTSIDRRPDLADSSSLTKCKQSVVSHWRPLITGAVICNWNGELILAVMMFVC